MVASHGRSLLWIGLTLGLASGCGANGGAARPEPTASALPSTPRAAESAAPSASATRSERKPVPHEVLADQPHDSCGGVAVRGKDLYYATGKGIWRVPTQGGKPESLFEGHTEDFVVGDAGLFVAQTGEAGRIARVESGVATQIGPPLAWPRALALVGSSIVFTQSGDSRDGDGQAIQSLARLPQKGGKDAKVEILFEGPKGFGGFHHLATDGKTLYFMGSDAGIVKGDVVFGTPSRTVLYRLRAGDAQPEVIGIDDQPSPSAKSGPIVLVGNTVYWLSSSNVYRTAADAPGVAIDEDGKWRIAHFDRERVGVSDGPFVPVGADLYRVLRGVGAAFTLVSHPNEEFDELLEGAWSGACADEARVYWTYQESDVCHVASRAIGAPR
ncbi:MAG: hypothetical protein U0414_35920 [Polyangiaceae bacterium]